MDYMYNCIMERIARETAEEMEEKIKEEKSKENVDKHRLMRLEEQRLMGGLFSDAFLNGYSKYCSPW